MFRFTIRELVLLTLVVAIGVGWWLDRHSSRQAQAKLQEQVDSLTGKSSWWTSREAANLFTKQEIKRRLDIERRRELQSKLSQ
jgi:hypothetical protein